MKVKSERFQSVFVTRTFPLVLVLIEMVDVLNAPVICLSSSLEADRIVSLKWVWTEWIDRDLSDWVCNSLS